MHNSQGSYLPISSSSSDEGDEKHQYPTSPRYSLILCSERLKDLALVLLSIAVVLLSIPYMRQSNSVPKAVSEVPGTYIPNIDDARYVPMKYITEYSPETIDDLDKVEAAWSALNPTIGIVAVSHEWAAQKGLPRADNQESDPTKGVYTLEAYHSLHCLIIVRRTMFQLARGEPLDAPFGHSMHCFDALRQSIMCQADDKLLYTKAGLADGEGQPRKCRSWDTLRTWAAENYACYQDNHHGVAWENQTGCAERRAYGDGMIMDDWASS